MTTSDRMRFFAGTSAPRLGKAICDNLDVSLGDWQFLPQKENEYWYSNGCFELELNQNCRGRTVYIMQTSLPDVNILHRQLIELFQLVMAASKSDTEDIRVFIPYFSYARSDKKSGRMPIASKMIASLLEKLGMDYFFGLELHSDQLELAFDCTTPVDPPTIFPHLIEHLKETGWRNERAVVLPGDEGSRGIAEEVAEALNLEAGVVKKDREDDDSVDIRSIEGDLKKKSIIIVDDEVCGATTVRAVAERAIEQGAREEIVVVTAHAIFAGNAVEKLQYPPIKKVITTDTVPAYRRVDPDLSLEVLSVAPFLAKAIEKIQSKGSVKKLYEIPPPEILVKPIQWELDPKFKEILALEREVEGQHLDYLKREGINSKVMSTERFGEYRALLKRMIVS